jgi:hypothetical protein
MKKKLKNILINILKIAVTAGGLYLAYGKFDWEQLNASNTDINWLYYSIAFLIFQVLLGLNTLRLQLISPSKINFWKLLKINFESRFFNLFLPTSIGGDVIRTVKFKKYTKTSSKSLSIIFIDRFIGMTAMIVLGTFFYLLPIVDKSLLDTWIELTIIGTFILVAGVWMFIFIDPLAKFAEGIINIIPIKKLREKIQELYNDIRDIKKVPLKKLLKAALTSIVSHSMNAVSMWLVALSLGLSIPLIQFIATLPVINTLLLVPISINGIGVRDYLIKTIYSPFTQSGNFILLAPLAFLVTLVTGAIGGIVYLLDKESTAKTAQSKKTAKNAQAEKTAKKD